MNNQGVHRRKFLQMGGTIAAACTIAPSLYGSALLAEPEALIIKEKMRLFSNENPYGPSKKVLESITNQMTRVNRYASFHQYDTNTLRETLAQRYSIDTNQVLLGHGSFEILCMLTRAFGQRKNSIIIPGLTFNVTGRFADKVFDHKCLQVPLDDAMQIDLEATKKAVTKETQLVYFCNPNNPTGRLLPAKTLEDFCKEIASSTCTVAIDEAYIDLVDPAARPDTVELLTEKYNVLIIRTFSKAYGLAGLRVGYALGLPATIERIRSQHYSFGGLINTVGVAAAITAIQHNAYIDIYRKQNNEVRSYVEKALKEFGIPFLPSTTNFLLMRVKDVDRYKTELKTAQISPVPGGWPNYSDWARISIGTQSEMDIFINAVSKMDWLVR